MRRSLAVAAVVSGLVLTACSSSHKGATTSSSTTGNSTSNSTTASSTAQQPVVIGSANFPENEVLADIYADALRNAGVPVSTKLNIGSREIYFKEMENGTLNVFPEYNGAILDYLQPKATASSTADVDTALASALPSSLEALNPAPAEDSDSVTVTSAFAAAHHLSSIADLAAIQSQVTIGAAPEFANRQEGLLGLKSIYGLTLKFKPLDESGPLTIAALNGGTIQAGDVYTTDPSVAKYHFVALTDPKHLFAAQNVIPIVNKSVATSKVTSTLNAVSAALTTSDLVQLVGAVENDHVDAATVASQFVSQLHLG
ncbi:MAG TPA: ABC transporter substrate-binding protein [Acidimicrobiales bacterium]|nr:ABC transporter substrate-binding protein [Acidimicrobiales bacterium]